MGLNNYPIQSNRYDFDWAALESQKTDASSMYNHYKKLLAIRNDYSALLSKGNQERILLHQMMRDTVYLKEHMMEMPLQLHSM